MQIIQDVTNTFNVTSVTLGAGITTVDASTSDTGVATAIGITIDATYNDDNVTNLDLSNVTTGTGDDTLKLENADFTNGDVFDFGGGTGDTLQIVDAATITNAQFTSVDGLETLKLGN